MVEFFQAKFSEVEFGHVQNGQVEFGKLEICKLEFDFGLARFRLAKHGLAWLDYPSLT